MGGDFRNNFQLDMPASQGMLTISLNSVYDPSVRVWANFPSIVDNQKSRPPDTLYVWALGSSPPRRFDMGAEHAFYRSLVQIPILSPHQGTV